jgi:D-alanyl-D-alanine carboxypeptidase
VLQLVTAGTVSLTDPLEKWVPGFPNGTSITIREVLNHSSGIFNYTDDTTFQSTEAATPSTAWTPAQLVAIAASHPAYFAPGAGWTYSNTDYILLGMLLEKATGKKAGSALHSLAIDKANLQLTTLDGYEAIKGTLAHGFSTSGADVSSLYDPSYAWTAGAMVSSGGDLLDWAAALYGGSVLDAAALAEMTTAVATGQAGVTYGLGVFVLDPSVTGGTTAWGHAGDIGGYHSQVFYYPAKKIAVASIVNSDSGDPNGVMVAGLGVLGYP